MSMIAMFNETALLLTTGGTPPPVAGGPNDTGFMGAVVTGVQIVGIGMIGWSAIKAAQEGDIWTSATRIVLGGVTLAFITEPTFRQLILDIIEKLVGETWN